MCGLEKHEDQLDRLCEKLSITQSQGGNKPSTCKNKKEANWIG